MNDCHDPCKQWAEAISMAAAGCLSSDQQREVRRHLESCSACRERFQKLTELCSALADLRLPTQGEDLAIIQRVKSATALSKPRQRLVRWSWSRAAATVVASFILAVTLRVAILGPLSTAPATRNVTSSATGQPESDAPSVPPSSRPPTLLAYERTFAQSDEKLERLLAQEAQRLDLGPAEITPLCRLKMESIP